MTARLHIDSFAGRRKVEVEIVGETPKRYRVRLLADCKLPGRNRKGKTGDVVLVPASAVTVEDYCPQCGGGGKREHGSFYRCERCNGNGWVTTEPLAHGPAIESDNGVALNMLVELAAKPESGIHAWMLSHEDCNEFYELEIDRAIGRGDVAGYGNSPAEAISIAIAQIPARDAAMRERQVKK